MPPQPIVRVRLRYADMDTFVDKYAPNVTKGGIFLATKDAWEVGARLRFEVALLDGKVALSGEGKVTWVKPFVPDEPHRPYGLGVQFTGLDPASRPVLDRLLEHRAATGRRPTGSVPVLAGLTPGSGAVRLKSSEPRATSDTRATETLGIPVATEFDRVEESSLRRVLDRARQLSGRTEDVEALLRPESDEAPSVAQAVAELPRYLAGGAGRRQTGLFRVPAEPATPEPAAPEPATPSPRRPDDGQEGSGEG